MVCLYSCFVKNRIKLRVWVSRLGFCLLLCLCGLACPSVVAVWSISSVCLLCFALLLLCGLVRLLFYYGLPCRSGLLFVCYCAYCVLSCCSGLFSVAVVFVLASLLAYLLCFAFPVCCCGCTV